MPAAAARREAPTAADALARFPFITTAIRRDLEKLVALLHAWQSTHNLVGASTLDDVWTRHIADSLQLIEHAPEFSEWVDLGSGAGFPALPIAIVCKHRNASVTDALDPHPRSGGGGPPKAVEGASAGRGAPVRPLHHGSHGPPPPLGTGEELAGTAVRETRAEQHFTLVEANAKKAAFLRAAFREIGVNATVASERIEAHAPKMRGCADVVSARALAPLPALLGLAQPYLHAESVLLMLKGQDFVQEIASASKSWDFDVVDSPSATDAGGRVLAIRRLRPKASLP